MRILIAEDEPVSRRFLQKLLEQWGHEVQTAEDGEQAWEVLSRPDPPPVVLLDWMMPRMDGLAVIRKLRSELSQTPVYVIVVTVLDDSQNVVMALEAGADDYVTKPFNAAELRARVEVGCRMVTLQQALARRIAELSHANEHILTLQGILPICMHCHKIRTDWESWQRLEAYIEDHSEVRFSHSLCPDCLRTHYPEAYYKSQEESPEAESRPCTGEPPLCDCLEMVR
ncbi:MAG: response regulator transcription factor [Thermodesulfobacteriota bacterium]